MPFYIVKTFDTQFRREWDIYSNWISTDKERLIEKVRMDLETEVLMEPVLLSEDSEGFLLVNGNPSQWLLLFELTEI